ncbi:MAG: ABC transporter permease [Anaerolineaceae bacterium]|jgi:simple sugar transport system permease protein
MNGLFSILTPELLAASIRIAAPIILAAMGGLLCVKAKVFNIALEGFMLIGAFFGIMAIEFSGGNVWVGLLAGAVSGVLASFIYSFCVLKLSTDHVITSIGMNLLASGLTATLLRLVFDTSGTFRPTAIARIPEIQIPFLVNVPVLGEALGHHSPIVYISFLVVILTYVLLMKTPFGLAIRSVGEHADAARTAGIHPEKVQFLAITWSGALCGLAGAYISSILVSQFIENMIQGRGFTAFIAIVFGGYKPFYGLLAALLFGFSEALGIRFELIGFGIPPSIIKTFPYLLSVIVLVVSSIIRSRNKLSTSIRS